MRSIRKPHEIRQDWITGHLISLRQTAFKMRGSIIIGRLGKTKISIHWTFAILLFWVSIASSSMTDVLWNLAFVLTVFLCVILHELGHIVAARYFGIGAKEITLLPIGGVATLEKLPTRPIEEIIVAIAGPLVNFILAGLLLLPVRDLFRHDLATIITAINGHNFIANIFMVNLAMGIFNMIPAFPMDGGRVLRALLALKLHRTKATKIAARTGQVLAIAAVMIAVFTNQNAISNPSLILISLFIFYSAQGELQSSTYMSIVGGHKAADVTMKDFATLAASEKLSRAVEKLLAGSYHSFLVFSNGRPAGTLGRTELIRSLSMSGQDAIVGDVMKKELRMLDEGTPLERVYETVMQHPEDPVLVMRNNKPGGDRRFRQSTGIHYGPTGRLKP
jgi:Zn-dependent protease